VKASQNNDSCMHQDSFTRPIQGTNQICDGKGWQRLVCIGKRNDGLHSLRLEEMGAIWL
jgi:hypothetical protein